MKNIKKLIFVCCSLMLVLNACKRDQYYTDGGLANPNWNGDMLNYLETKAVRFDTIAQIVKLAGLEDDFRKTDFTFFAPDDGVIKRTIGNMHTPGSLNWYLYTYSLGGKGDTVISLSQINPLVWRKYIQSFMFKGINRLKDYPQIDLSLRSIHPGALYYSYSGSVVNIGVSYASVNGVQYLGARTLEYSYIPDISHPDDGYYTNHIASSDIKPTNGVVHALQDQQFYFGYDIGNFINDVYNTGLGPKPE